MNNGHTAFVLRSHDYCQQGWRVRLAGWLLSREARRLWRADGQDVSIIVSRSITSDRTAGKGTTNE